MVCRMLVAVMMWMDTTQIHNLDMTSPMKTGVIQRCWCTHCTVLLV